MKRLSSYLVVGAALALLVVAVPAFAAEPLFKPFDRVPAGMDYWQTLGSGATEYSFAHDPLPRGFFCDGSKAFTGILKFEGVPLRTNPLGILGTTDTIIERLDDAVFDAKGVAMTRIQVRALQLVSANKIATPCGKWRAVAQLAADEQPITPMRLTRTNDFGGDYQADLWLKVAISFVRDSDGATRTATRVLHLPTAKTTAYACWTRSATYATSSPAAGAESFSKTAEHEKVTVYTYVNVSNGTLTARVFDFNPNGCVVGYQCNRQGTCLPVYSWHEAFDDENHFVYSPCKLGYTQFCDADVDAAYYNQLKGLRDLGILDDDPEVVIERLHNPVGEELLPIIKK